MSVVYYSMEFFVVDWETYHDHIFELGKKIVASGKKIDLIVAIARGGLMPARILSDLTELPITTFTISSYHDLKQSSIPQISLHLGNKLHNKKILLIDDVSDTGKSFIRAVDYLKSLGAEEIVTASVYIKPKTVFIPDFYLLSTDKWIVFPHDVKETVDSLYKIGIKEGKTPEEITKQIESIGFSPKQVKFFLEQNAKSK